MRWVGWFVMSALLCAPSAAAQFPSGQTETAPWGIHVAYGVDPRHSVSIAFLVPRDSEYLSFAENKRMNVEYGTTTGYGEYAHVSARPYQEIGTQTPFIAYLTGLEPGTTYHYRIGSTLPGYSDDRTFRTAPADASSFRVTVYGDQGTGRVIGPEDPESILETPDAHATNLIVADVLAERPDFHLHLGDLSYDDWDEWQRLIEPLASNVTYMVIPGNHDIDEERNIQEYDARTAMPSPAGAYYYAFTYGNARFIGLDSESWCEREFSQFAGAAGVYYGCPEDHEPNQAQLAFLRAELDAARHDPAIRFIVPFLHRPFLSDGEHGGDPNLQRWWRPLFDEYRPELVLSGHDHLYERSVPVVDNRPAEAGTTYVVTGGAGHGLYEFRNETLRDWEAARARAYHYAVLDFSGDTIVLTAKDLDGNTLDAATLHSNADVWREQSALAPPPRMPGLESMVALAACIFVVLAMRRSRA